MLGGPRRGLVVKEPIDGRAGPGDVRAEGAEGVVVLFSHAVTKWTVIVLAIVGVIGWLGGRDSRSHIVRQVLWIFAAAQLLAVVLVILAWLVKWAIILAIVVLAIVGLAYLFADRR